MSKLASLKNKGGANARESMGARKRSPAETVEAPATQTIPPHAVGVSRADVDLRQIEVARIDSDPAQPRKEFNKDELDQLAATLLSVGQIQPIEVWWDAARSVYRILCGERRWRAAKQAGLATLTAVVREKPGHADRLARQIIENLARANLSPIEEAKGFDVLIRSHGWKAADVARELGISPGRVSRSLALLDMPFEIKEMVAAGELSASSAIEITTKIESPTKQVEIASEAADNNWSRADLRKEVSGFNREVKAETPERPAPVKTKVDRYGERTFKVGDRLTVFFDDRGIEEDPTRVREDLRQAMEQVLREIGPGAQMPLGSWVRDRNGNVGTVLLREVLCTFEDVVHIGEPDGADRRPLRADELERLPDIEVIESTPAGDVEPTRWGQAGKLDVGVRVGNIGPIWIYQGAFMARKEGDPPGHTVMITPPHFGGEPKPFTEVASVAETLGATPREWLRSRARAHLQARQEQAQEVAPRNPGETLGRPSVECEPGCFKVRVEGVEEAIFLRAMTLEEAQTYLGAVLPVGAVLTFEPLETISKFTTAARVPSKLTDYTALEEAEYCPRGEREKPSPHDVERIAALKDYRERVASGKALPQWGKWSEFWIHVGGAPINVIHEGNRPWHLTFRGPISSTGYKSHFLDGEEVRTMKGVGLVPFAVEKAKELQDKLRVEYAKRFKRRKGKSKKDAPREVELPEPEGEKAQGRCFWCNGTGRMCSRCGESEAACECGQDGEDFLSTDCHDCNGTGH